MLPVTQRIRNGACWMFSLCLYLIVLLLLTLTLKCFFFFFKKNRHDVCVYILKCWKNKAFLNRLTVCVDHRKLTSFPFLIRVACELYLLNI